MTLNEAKQYVKNNGYKVLKETAHMKIYIAIYQESDGRGGMIRNASYVKTIFASSFNEAYKNAKQYEDNENILVGLIEQKYKNIF